jgi:nicotinamidase-related amidase
MDRNQTFDRVLRLEPGRTALPGALRARGVTALVVTGTMSDICVLADEIALW